MFYEDADLSEVPVPDLTNPDPRVAAGAIYEFETWVTTVAPVRDWAGVLAAPSWDQRAGQQSNGVPTLYDPVVGATQRPYEVVEIRGVLTSPDS